MPTYAYACTACEHTFEVQQSFSDSSLTVCPECDGRLRKLFSSVGVVFKGSGFYRNDARAGAIKASTSHRTSESSSASGSGSGSGSSASTVSASKPSSGSSSSSSSTSGSSTSGSSSTSSSSTSSSSGA